MEDERENARVIGYGGVTGHPLLWEEARREDALAWEESEREEAERKAARALAGYTGIVRCDERY